MRRSNDRSRLQSRIEPDFPATLSHAAIDGMLRGELDFDRVVISDDMQMGAVANHYGFETAIERAISAGVDIINIGEQHALSRGRGIPRLHLYPPTVGRWEDR